MKRNGRRTIARLLLVCLLALACAGCAGKETTTAAPAPAPAPAAQPAEQPAAAAKDNTAQTPEPAAPAEPEVDYNAVYAPVLDEIYALLCDGIDEDGDYPNAPGGIIEAAGMSQWENPANQLMRIGSLVADVNGDGVFELLVGTMPDGEQGLDQNGEIFGGYTCKDGEPVLFLEGWSRNCWRWMGGGRFYNFGSSGAAYSEFSTWQLDANATELRCEDFWFSDVAADDPEKQVFFHNSTGEWDKDNSEPVDMDGEAFWDMSNQLEGQCMPLPLTQLIDYEPVTVSAFAGGSKVFAAFLDDVASSLDYYDDAAELYAEAFPAGGEYETKVVFFTNVGVKDFKLLSLELTGVDDDGNASFNKTEIFNIPGLRNATPLAVPMSFPGDIPTNGFSYTDEDGTTKTFAIGISGKDGSLYISPID